MSSAGVAEALLGAAALIIAAATLWLWRFLRGSGRPVRRNTPYLLYPASQLMSIAFAAALHAMSGRGEFAVSLVALAGLASAALDPVLFRGLLQAEQSEEAAASAAILAEQVAAQRAHLADAQEAAERSKAEAAQVERLWAGVVDALEAGDAAAAQALVAGGEETLPSRACSRCENRAVDALLALKAAQAAERGASLRANAVVPGDLGVLTDAEACAVLANLVDNALEACGQGTVAVDVRVAAGSLAVRVENPVAATVGAREPAGAALPEHGWGQGIVREVARRHGGTFSAAPDGDGRYVARVLIPLG